MVALEIPRRVDNRIAPVENLSDDESTGESIPYNDAKEDRDSGAENQEDNDEEVEEEDEEGV